MLEPLKLNAMVGVPRDLRNELIVAAQWSPITASFDGVRPVAFCPAARTESLWDISRDAGGIPGAGISYPVRRVHDQRLRPLRPVWVPEETNLALLRLTATLECVPANELPVFRALLRSRC